MKTNWIKFSQDIQMMALVVILINGLNTIQEIQEGHEFLEIGILLSLLFIILMLWTKHTND